MSALRQEFKKGEKVLLDGKHEVTVVLQTPKKLYTQVTSNGEDTWDVMTIRLGRRLPTNNELVQYLQRKRPRYMGPNVEAPAFNEGFATAMKLILEYNESK
tara:strand:+ start:447 stop:749 length:303 start_codon:yes stop_codon:yes gene_type:complete